MSQQSVERVIGILATNEGRRRRFEKDPAGVLAGLRRDGLQLTAVEYCALASLDAAALRRFAECLDSRIQKLSLGRIAAESGV